MLDGIIMILLLRVEFHFGVSAATSLASTYGYSFMCVMRNKKLIPYKDMDVGTGGEKKKQLRCLRVYSVS